MRVIEAGTPSAEAIMKVYGRPVAQVDKDLQAYLRGSSFRGALVPAKIEKNTDEFPLELLAEFDVATMFADLTSRPGKETDVEAKLQALQKQDPKRPSRIAGWAILRGAPGARRKPSRISRRLTIVEIATASLVDYGRLAERNPVEAMVGAWGIAEAGRGPPGGAPGIGRDATACASGAGGAGDAAADPQDYAGEAPRRLSRRGLRIPAHRRAKARKTADRFKAIAKTDDQRQAADLLISQYDSQWQAAADTPGESG